MFDFLQTLQVSLPVKPLIGILGVVGIPMLIGFFGRKVLRLGKNIVPKLWAFAMEGDEGGSGRPISGPSLIEQRDSAIRTSPNAEQLDSAIKTLQRVATSDPQWNVRTAAVEQLGRMVSADPFKYFDARQRQGNDSKSGTGVCVNDC